MTSVGLAMIVRNEAPVITRALDSARPFVDRVLVEDTGSSDGTQNIIKGWLDDAGIPGEVIEEPWQSFGHNRSHVLAEMRKQKDVDYVLMHDADETITFKKDPVAIKQQLSADIYHVEMRLGSLIYSLPRITRNSLPFYYRGPVHEFVDCKIPFKGGSILSDISVREVGGGAREKDPDTYKRDAQLFEEALKRPDLDDLERSRYTFYLAQSFRDSRQYEPALLAYLRRVALGGWPEEIYISLLNVARIQEALGRPLVDVIGTYKRAIEINNQRLEAIHGATKACRNAGLCKDGYAIAKEGISLPMPQGLFIESWIYQYGLLDEFSICAYYAQHFSESWLAAQLVLTKEIDEATRERVVKNAQFATDAIKR